MQDQPSYPIPPYEPGATRPLPSCALATRAAIWDPRLSRSSTLSGSMIARQAQLRHHLEPHRPDHPVPRHLRQAVQRELQTRNQQKQKESEHRVGHDFQRRSTQTAL